MTTVSNMVSLGNVFDIALQRHNAKDIAFNEDNPETAEIVRQNPLAYLDCRLAGNLVVATATATADLHVGMALIESFELRIDGKDVIFSCPGFMLQKFSQVHTRSAPLATAPALTAGTNAFEYAWRIPIDLGNYFSLLDASANHSLIAKVQWGAPEDGWTAGGGGTIDVSSVVLEIDAVGVVGVGRGMPGGVEYGYARHQVMSREQIITAAESNLIVELLKKHVYSRVMLWTISDAALVDTILNKISVRIGNTIMQTIERDMLQVENMMRYALSACWTGVYVFDFAEPGRLEQMLALTGTQRFELVVDVAHPGTTDKLYILEDTFIQPTKAA
ncbi:MAG: hypothetical protein A2V98_04860 [Planctomycetes bacterium RBG_16_64_12]|nr:MAG: hypothetical protein A2V98_04860 [Planctomycetes bacterium RBG_16_64_12]